MLSCAMEYTLMGGWKAIVARDALRRMPNDAGEEAGGHSVVRTFVWRCVLNVLQVRPAAPHDCVLFARALRRRACPAVHAAAHAGRDVGSPAGMVDTRPRPP